MNTPKPTILIVDDDPGIRKMWIEILALEGYPIQSAANGVDGLEFMRSSAQPLLVVTGLAMPVMDGWEMLRIAGREGLLDRYSVLIVSGNAFSLLNLPQDASDRMRRYYEGLADVRRLCDHYHIERLPKKLTIDEFLGGVERAAERLYGGNRAESG
jgi:two-component system response regulator (stage 0 sporulation protein F)